MDIFFADSTEIPLPPEDVRILELKAEPYPDGRRVRVFLSLTPFLKPPNGDIHITDQEGNLVATSSFIGAITPRLEMTLHLRPGEAGGSFTLSATLYYTEEIQGTGDEAEILASPENTVVDQASVDFTC
jgi:hypothetical protein